MTKQHYFAGQQGYVEVMWFNLSQDHPPERNISIQLFQPLPQNNMYLLSSVKALL